MITGGRPALNLLTGTFMQYVLLGVNVVIGIVLMPITMRHFGQADYGLWMLVASMTAYFQLLDLGYGSGLLRHVTEADARGDEGEINVVLSTFVVVYSLLGVVALAATALLALVVLPQFPNLTPAQVWTGQAILALLGLRIAIGFPMSVFGAVTTARQRFAASSAIAIVTAIAQGIATYAAVVGGYGLVTLVAVTTTIGVLSYVPYAMLARRTFPGLRLTPRAFSRRHVREITAFSFYLFVIGVAYQIGPSADNLIIGAYVGTAAIAVFTVAARLVDFQRQVCGQFIGLLFPLVVRFHASNDRAAVRTTLLEGTRLGVVLAAGVALGLIAFGRDVIVLWMGPGFETSAAPLYVLAIVGTVMVAQGPTGTVLLATGRHRLVAWASIAEIALNVGLSVLLVRRFGLVGVAIGTAVPYALINLVVLMPAACRQVDLEFRAFLNATAVPAIVALVPASIVAAVLPTAPAPALPALLVSAAIVALVYVAAFWGLGLRGADRARYVASTRDAFRGFVTRRAAVATSLGLQWRLRPERGDGVKR